MAVLSTTVELNLGIAEANDFILDDATRGVLDGVTYVLADGFSETTGETTSVTISRGRFSQLFDVFDAASVTVTLNNEDRAFDPQYSSSPYYGYIRPGRDIKVKTGGVAIFVGTVEDWNFDYDVSGRSMAVVTATDGLGLFGYQKLIGFSGSAGEVPVQRLVNVCLEVSWPMADTEFDQGVFTLQGDTPSNGTNALGYLQTVARTDLGYLFVSRTGKITFKDRHHFINNVASSATFGPANIPFSGLSVEFGSEQLYSEATVQREGGTAQTATVADLQTFVETYRVPRSLSVSGLLHETDVQALSMASYLVSLYDEPEYRFDSMNVTLGALTTNQQQTVLALDIGSVVTVSFTPNQVGSAITKNMIIQGIRHDIAPAQHVITFSFIDADLREFFELDSATHGVLDTNRLGI